MKRIFFVMMFVHTVFLVFAQEKNKDSFYTLSPVEVRATRANQKSPFTTFNISKNEIAKQNLGQDLPFLLNQVPGIVINSDAGNGVGYTNLRLRGSDASRINVTLNGIPFNDAESQGTFFVNLGDFTSSVNSIQVQRGVGTSSNGAGAFGGTINLSTNETNKNAYLELNNSYGSFHTWKNTVKAGTGLIRNHFITDVRLSRISSSGFIDRATSDIQSFYFSQQYLSNRSTLRLNIFSGKEKTYQAWNGISQSDLDAGNRTVNYSGTEKPVTPYDNETDNYTQTHYQLFYDKKINSRTQFNLSGFLVRGKGYYENYKSNRKYANYNLPNVIIKDTTIKKSDFVQQQWLDNYFYGNVFSLLHNTEKSQYTLGGGWSNYEGDHIGKVIWAKYGLPSTNNIWYDLPAYKKEANLFFKHQYTLHDKWVLFYDLQGRLVKYDIKGFKNNPSLLIKSSQSFFNPKIGITYLIKDLKAYASYSIANKEPNRADFEAGNNEQPIPERLYDFEAGVAKSGKKYFWAITLYHMQYKNQLVLTGKINDVGAQTRTNVDKSYRQGIELEGSLHTAPWLRLGGSLALSRNKINTFNEFIPDWDNGTEVKRTYKNVDISFSPSVIANTIATMIPAQNLELSLLSKYVGKQYLDNTENSKGYNASIKKQLDAFFVHDIRAIYTFKSGLLKNSSIIGQINNLFNEKYEPNGYTFSYMNGTNVGAENYYFPMAGLNFMVGLNIKL